MTQPVQSSQEPKSSQPLQMPPVPKKRNWFSRVPPKVRTAIAIGVIALAVILAFRGPQEGESDNVTGDPAVVPTVAVTNMVDTMTINHSVNVSGLHVTLTKAIEATKFSNDRKRGGTYTVRIMAQARNNGPNSVGVQFDRMVRLVLPDGQIIAPKYLSLSPTTLAGKSQDGFFDFPVSTRVSLSSLALRFGSDTTVAFNG